MGLQLSLDHRVLTHGGGDSQGCESQDGFNFRFCYLLTVAPGITRGEHDKFALMGELIREVSADTSSEEVL